MKLGGEEVDISVKTGSKPPKLEIAKVYAMDSKIAKEQARQQVDQWHQNVEHIKDKKFT